MNTTFDKALSQHIKSQKTFTDNGAIAYASHGGDHSALLDLNFSVTELRHCTDTYPIIRKFQNAFYEDKVLALRWLGYAMDIRQGLGERNISKKIIGWLIETHPDIARGLIRLIPEYNRWDMLFIYMGTALESDMLDVVYEQLIEDFDNYYKNEHNKLSLLAKWMPSINCHSKARKLIAKKICKNIGISEREYRTKIAKLRNALHVVECDISANRWDKIDYKSVPSKANVKYKSAFMRHDAERRIEFINRVNSGDEKIKSTVNTPYDIVKSYNNDDIRFHGVDATLEALWKALPDYGVHNSETLTVIDTSGSMDWGFACKPKHVAFSIGIYLSERCNGQFSNKAITFSRSPQYIDFSNMSSLYEKLRYLETNSINENTNIEAVFELILDTAKKFNLSQDELPKRILIISDMQFDAASRMDECGCKTLFETIADRYTVAGYAMPKLVFWNVHATPHGSTIPLQSNSSGLITVSGFSPSIMKMVLSNKLDPFDALADILMTERYSPFLKCLKS
jgi:hypothetical protein